MVLASALAILVICRFIQLSVLPCSRELHSLPSRPRPFQESASWRAFLAAARLLVLSFIGPSSFLGRFERRPAQPCASGVAASVTAGRSLAPGLHCFHYAHVLGSFASASVTDSQASAAASAAVGQASFTSCAEQNANFKSIGLAKPVSLSHASRGVGASSIGRREDVGTLVPC